MISHVFTSNDGDLYIGNANDAKRTEVLRQEGFTAVLNVATDLVSPPDVDPMRLKVGLTDGPSNPHYLYEAASDLLDYLIRNSHKVLLHCHEGRSRSSAVATLWLYKHAHEYGANKYETLSDAWQVVCQSRPLCEGMAPCHMENLRKICG